MSVFVSPQWLYARLDDADVVVVDASWYLPAMARDAEAEYREGHIPGAVRFDIDTIADTTRALPHMLPDAERFARMVGARGIGSDRTIVVYDGPGLFCAPRVWWSLVTMGARDVRILEGGATAWRAEGLPLSGGIETRAPETFLARPDPERLADMRAVATAAQAGQPIADARPADRFAGTTPEPRPGLRAGHIPGSVNLPASALVEDGRLKDTEALVALFRQAGVPLDTPVTTTCGSGVTAATLALALEQAGAPKARVYDGSWAEWGADPETPVETGR